MLEILGGILLFILAFIVHLIIWKIRVPERQIRALVLIFFMVFIMGVVAFIFLSKSNSFFFDNGGLNASQYITLSILFLSLTAAYFFLYAGLIDEGPSLTIILNIAQAGERGIKREHLEELITKDTFMSPRIKFLVEGNFASKIGDKFVIAKKGKFFLSIVCKLRRWMNISSKIG